ncbi:MAG: hypothetical protein ACKVYV_14665 [Limisphaerales bacterium]
MIRAVSWIDEFVMEWQAKDAARKEAIREASPLKGSMEILGVHPVRAETRCHLIEIRIAGAAIKFSLHDVLSEITQEVPGRNRSMWQTVYEECLLNEAGENVMTDASAVMDRKQGLRGGCRLVFFFNELDFGRPLLTPFGPLTLPKPTRRPARLRRLKYESSL